jgi:hypothetical protein
VLSILRVMAKHSMFVTTPEEFSIIRVVLVLGLTTPSISTAPSGGVVRGLLCARCKVGVATFRDQADILRAAAEYLDSRHYGDGACGAAIAGRS